MRKGRAMKETGQIVFGIIGAIVALVLVVVLTVTGLIWYIQSNWGVEGVEAAWRNVSMFGLAACAAVAIFVGWILANRSHNAGAQVAANVMSQSVDAYGAASEYLAAGQKSIHSAMALQKQRDSAFAAQAKAEADIKVLAYRAQLEERKQAALPAPEPVRRAPWEQPALPARSSAYDEDDDRGTPRYSVMH